MKSNTEKKKPVTFTMIRIHLFAKLTKWLLKWITSFKYLVAHLSFNLTCYCDIEQVTNKTSKTLGFIKGQLALAGQNNMLLAYTSLVQLRS